MKSQMGYIANEGMTFDGKDFWLIERNTNWICKLSGRNMKYRYIRRLPEIISEMDIAKNYAGIIWNSCLYCIPFRTEKLWIYNIDVDEFEGVSLPREKSGNPYIQGCWIVNGYLWLAGYRGEIWKIYIKDTKEITYYNLGNDLSGESMGNEFWCDGSYIYGTDNDIGVVIKFNMQDGSVNKLVVDKNINGFNTIYKSENILYLTGRDGFLYKYSLTDENYSKNKILDEIRNYDNHLFIKSYLYDEKLILCPWIPGTWEKNMIVAFDIKRKESFFIDESEGGDNIFLSGYFMNGKLYFGFDKQNDLYIYSFDEMKMYTLKCEKMNMKSRNRDLISKGPVLEGENMNICNYLDCI